MKKILKQPHKGFTLIEFIVIISIFAIMAAVALFNFQGFRSNVAINNLAHDIALTIRQAQVFGWAGQSETDAAGAVQTDPNTGNPIRYADGIYFPYSNSAFAKQFVLYTKFDPTPGAESYDPSDITNDTIGIEGAVRIAGISFADTAADLALDPAHHIPSGNATQASDSVSVAFSRPRPEAMFFEGSAPRPFQYMAVYVAGNPNDPSFIDHWILVSRFGEIEVQ